MPSVASRACRSPYGFSERIAELLDRIDCRPALSAGEREAIFRLRYRAYLSEGAIKPSFAQTFTDSYDESDNAWLLGLYLDGELASSIRLHVACAACPDFPSREVFAELLEPEIAAGKVVVDPTRFVTEKELSRANPGLPYATVRLGWLAAEHFGAAHLLAAVRVEHQAFYRRTFNHRLIGAARPYPLLAQPISLMTVHYASVAGRVHQRYPFFRSTFFERRMLFDRASAAAHFAFPPAAAASGIGHAA
ncbi:MAG TPA: hypothetical protein VK456_09750 [Xanthobacteraceae bacterium]|nr:hypothetical protein [Xanthobacteraceae bacterium]